MSAAASTKRSRCALPSIRPRRRNICSRALALRLKRRMSFQLSVTEGQLYFTLNGDSLDGAVVRLSLVSVA